MIVTKRNLKKIINNYLEEGFLSDLKKKLQNDRYPFHNNFLKTAMKNTVRFFVGEDSSINYEKMIRKYYNDLGKMRPNKMSIEDCLLIILDHYDHFREESYFAKQTGDSEGISQIKPQAVIDALRGGPSSSPSPNYKKIVKYAKSISKNDADKNLIDMLYYYLVIGHDGLTNHEGEEIKSSGELKKHVEAYMEDASNSLNVFLGVAYATMESVGTIKKYMGGKPINNIRKSRHGFLQFLINNIVNKNISLEKLKKLYEYYDEAGFPSNDPMEAYIDILKRLE